MPEGALAADPPCRIASAVYISEEAAAKQEADSVHI